MSGVRLILWLGLRDLYVHRRLILIMSLSIAIAVAMHSFLETYRGGLTTEFSDNYSNLLEIHDLQNIGDVSGSRISSDTGVTLAKMGVSSIIPEIRVVTGTSIQNATLLRGIDLKQYTHLESFSMLSGRSLKPGDTPRLAMIGTLLAERQKLKVGDIISLRGRNFDIIGIFQNGSYMDNQAWISLSDAQTLLGWGQDVSIYLIPDEGILRDGDTLPGGLAVTHKGENLKLIAAQYQPLLNIWDIVSYTLGIAASLTLANVLWRLALLRRHDMAILRTTGFPTMSIVGYLLVQALGVSLLGVLIGGLFTIVLASSVRLTISTFTIIPQLDASTLVPGLGWIGLIMLAGSLLPAWWLSQLNLAQLLRSE